MNLGVAALVLGSIVPRVAAETSWTSCGNYSDALNSVAAGLAASRVCSGSIWKKETAMSHTLSMGSLLKLYPLEILTHTECRIFFAQRLKENVSSSSTAINLLRGPRSGPQTDEVLGRDR